MDFSAALEAAISATQKQAQRTALVATLGGGALVAIASVAIGRPFGLIPVVIVAGVLWYGALTGTPTTKALRSLRGATPEHWLPSPSHGVVMVSGKHLLAGGIRVELDRHASNRLTSISYDEAAHALTLSLTKVVQTRDGEREQVEQPRATLDRAVPAERAYAFAKHVLGLSQR